MSDVDNLGIVPDFLVNVYHIKTHSIFPSQSLSVGGVVKIGHHRLNGRTVYSVKLADNKRLSMQTMVESSSSVESLMDRFPSSSYTTDLADTYSEELHSY